MDNKNISFDSTDLTVLEMYSLVACSAQESFDAVDKPAREKLRRGQQQALFVFHQKFGIAKSELDAASKALRAVEADSLDAAHAQYKRLVDKAFLERDWLISEAHRECVANHKKFKHSEVRATCESKEKEANDAYNEIEAAAAFERDMAIAEAHRIFAFCIMPFQDIHAMAMEVAQTELDAERAELALVYESETAEALKLYKTARSQRTQSWLQYSTISRTVQEQ